MQKTQTYLCTIIKNNQKPGSIQKNTLSKELLVFKKKPNKQTKKTQHILPLFLSLYTHFSLSSSDKTTSHNHKC